MLNARKLLDQLIGHGAARGFAAGLGREVGLARQLEPVVAPGTTA
jgi:hypothetical protein